MKTYEERANCVQQKLQRKNKQRKALMATAGALCICLVIGIVLPHVKNDGNSGIDISNYSDSEYIKVIEAINRDLPQNSNGNGFGSLWYGGAMDMVTGAVPEAAAPGATPDYGMNIENSTNSSVEITDHQVAGVLEADIIKRSQTHIFYLKGNILAQESNCRRNYSAVSVLYRAILRS